MTINGGTDSNGYFKALKCYRIFCSRNSGYDLNLCRLIRYCAESVAFGVTHRMVRILVRGVRLSLPGAMLSQTGMSVLPLAMLSQTGMSVLPLAMLSQTGMSALPLAMLSQTGMTVLPLAMLSQTGMSVLPLAMLSQTGMPVLPSCRLDCNRF